MPPRISSAIGLNVASRLKDIRKVLGVTQELFAEMTGVTRNHVADVETLRVEPSLDFIAGLLTYDLYAPGPLKPINPYFLLLGANFEEEMFGERPKWLLKQWLKLPLADRETEIHAFRGASLRAGWVGTQPWWERPNSTS